MKREFSLVFGAILAGGGSRRMGADKALMPLGGVPLIARAAQLLAPQVSHLSVVGASEAAKEVLGASGASPVFLEDAFPGQRGPLAGLLASMDWALTLGGKSDTVVITAVDTPFLPDDLVIKLTSAVGNAEVAFARDHERTHYMVSAWRLGLAGELRGLLRKEQVARIRDFAAPHDPVEVLLEGCGPNPKPLLNLNHPEDLVEAEKLLSQR